MSVIRSYGIPNVGVFNVTQRNGSLIDVTLKNVKVGV